MINIIGNRVLFLWISIVLFIVAIIFLGVDGIKLGFEFSSGSQLILHFTQTVTQSELQQEIASLGYNNEVRPTETGDFQVRTQELTTADKTKLEEALTAQFGTLEERGFDDIGPEASTETARVAAIAVAVACVGILIYLMWAFRRVPRSFRYGVCAIAALVHDVIIVLGVFAILGRFGWEINLMFITGILAVIGYSVNNVVIIFDRIRENVRLGVSSDFAVVVNNSIVETMGRGLNTSLTTIFAVLAVMLFVGSSIQNFVVVLLVGIIIGVYSSLFVAPTLLVMWDKGEWRRIIFGTRIKTAKAAG